MGYNTIVEQIESLLGTFAPLLVLGILYALNKLSGDYLAHLIKRFFLKIKSIIKKEGVIGKDLQDVINIINDNLTELRVNLKADRAYIIEFHNGSEFSSKFPQWKISQSYEKNAPGISYESYLINNNFVSLYWDDYIKIFFSENKPKLPRGVKMINSEKMCQFDCGNTKKIFLFNIEEMDYDAGPTRNIMEKKGIKYSLQTPIFSLKKDVIGILAVDYIFEDADIDFDTDYNICNICKYSSNLSYLWKNWKQKEKILKQHLKILKNEGRDE